MLDALARGVIRRPVVTVMSWLLIVLACLSLAFGVVGEGLFGQLHSGEPRVPGAESQEGRELLSDDDVSGEQVTLLVRGTDLADEAEVASLAAAMFSVREDLLERDGVQDVLDPFQAPEGPADPRVASLVSQHRDGFLLIVEMAPELEDDAARVAVEEQLRTVPGVLADAAPAATGIVSSNALVTGSVTEQLEADLVRGEAIALPLSLLVMVVVFGGFLAAGIPLLGALASIAGGMGVLLVSSRMIELDSVVVNVVTVLGLGLSIDYGLLIVSRFREEVRAITEADEALATATAGIPVRRRRRRVSVADRAVRRTMTTAGRTVAFSAVTIAIAVSSLMLLAPDILRSLGAAGVAVVVIALATALTLVPALLVLLGDRMVRPSVLRRVPVLRGLISRLGDVPPEDGAFSRLARGVHRRPWLVLTAVLVVLGVLASPVLGMQLRNSTTDLIPAGSDQREFITQLSSDYPGAASPTVVVVADGDQAAVTAWAAEVAALDGVTGTTEIGLTPDGNHAVLGVDVDSADPGGEVATDVVRAIRDLEPGFSTWVVGQAANQQDFVAAILEGLPLAGTLVVLATFALLFLMTGSLLIPLKALLVNALGIAAALGVTVWIFQEGHLSGLLGFEPVGGLESYVVAVVVAFGFGLAMDYEVFLLARIKEYWDAGHDNDAAVEHGLQHSGRIITSAALIIALVFLGFVAGELMMIKQVGVALAVTVLVDATLVRMLLVPATMTLLGRWNWWAPTPLRALHARVGISH
ncbi:MMPL family transporter [Georgenia sp. MJ170]|uniref:MMPL family transporter n=1 Tax=Georgenia sunbinii TaxID=3117728 RepID=UPI002F2657A9